MNTDQQEIAALRRRAEMAEADAAALRQLIEQYLADVEMSATELRKGIKPDHPGAALLAELEAARAIVEFARDIFAPTGASTIDLKPLRIALEAYDAVVKVRSE